MVSLKSFPLYLSSRCPTLLHFEKFPKSILLHFFKFRFMTVLEGVETDERGGFLIIGRLGVLLIGVLLGKADLEVEPRACLDGRTLRRLLFLVVLPLVSGRRVGPAETGLTGPPVVGGLGVSGWVGGSVVVVEGKIGPSSLPLVLDRVGVSGWAGDLIGAAFGRHI